MRRVLVIEDDPAILRLISINLVASGLTVIAAEDGVAGLAAAECEAPDLIILDLRMTGISGWDVLGAIRASARTRNIPAIILSGALKDSDEALVKEKGAQGMLLKPFAVADMLQLVARTMPDRRMEP